MRNRGSFDRTNPFSKKLHMSMRPSLSQVLVERKDRYCTISSKSVGLFKTGRKGIEETSEWEASYSGQLNETKLVHLRVLKT